MLFSTTRQLISWSQNYIYKSYNTTKDKHEPAELIVFICDILSVKSVYRRGIPFIPTKC